MRFSLKDARLYGILDLDYVDPNNARAITARLVEGRVDILQLRAKNADLATIRSVAQEIIDLPKAAGIPFILNDFPELSVELECDGVHVGQDDGDMDSVRKIVGEDAIVGRSTHSPEQAAAAASDPRTDYIGFGPLFPTQTKPGRPAIGLDDIRAVHEAHPDFPIFCIGGIKAENLSTIRSAGAQRVVIVSEILQADDPVALIRQIKKEL